MVQMLNFMVYVFYHNLKNISIGNRKKERVRGRERKEGREGGRELQSVYRDTLKYNTEKIK